MKNSFLQSAATHGLLIGLALIILSLADWSLGFYGQKVAFSLLTYVIIGGGLIWSVMAYRQQTGGYISYGQAFGFSLTVAVAYAIVTAVFSLLLTQVIDPAYVEKILVLTEEKLLEQGMPDAVIDQALDFSRKFAHPAISFIVSIIFTMFISAIFALITSAIAKKNNPNPFAGIENLN
jgi:hypothetical protein